MFQIKNTLVSESIIENDFVCNLSACKGACCIEGNAGAPLEAKELDQIKKFLPIVKRYLSPKSINEITKSVTKVFHENCKSLNCLAPTEEPRATDHIKEMVEMTKSLIEKKFAYTVEGHVYFSVSTFKEYGKLSNKNLDELKSGSRIEISKLKKNPIDFVLWKPSLDDDPGWNSPWGRGRPGWHLECSVMSEKYLGKNFDIHGGGLDLIFPHHENEIANHVVITQPKNFQIIGYTMVL